MPVKGLTVPKRLVNWLTVVVHTCTHIKWHSHWHGRPCAHGVNSGGHDSVYPVQSYACTLASPAMGHCGTCAVVIQHCNLFSSCSSSTKYKVSRLPVQQCIVYSDVPVPPHTKSWRRHCTCDASV